MFDPGGSTGRLRACPFLETWRALLCEELFVRVMDGTRGLSVFWQKGGLGISFSRDRYNSYVLRSIDVSSQPNSFEYVKPSRFDGTWLCELRR